MSKTDFEKHKENSRKVDDVTEHVKLDGFMEQRPVTLKTMLASVTVCETGSSQRGAGSSSLRHSACRSKPSGPKCQS